MYTTDLSSIITRGFTAIGICAAWIGLVFIGGRIPVLGGDFNIMFYNIIKKIFKMIVALSFVVMGLGLANMAIYSSNMAIVHQTEPIGLRHSFMQALVMTLGEYNLSDMELDKLDYATLNFAILILLCTIVFGSLIIINLFVAVLVSDVKALREEGFHQVLSI